MVFGVFVEPIKIEEIKNRLDIVQFISEYLVLKKAGRNFVGLCPFHQEKTPSFTVSPEKQIFYCFGCGAGGNVITFLMKMTGKSFPEAIKELAEKTGVVLPLRASEKESRQKASLRESIIDINTQAARWFSQNLFSAVGTAARKYLIERGIPESIMKEFQLGFASDLRKGLVDYVSRRGLSLKLLEQAGLILAGKDGDYYDRFRGRIMFPIKNSFGEIVAFGGRSLAQTDPKYLNSPESPVYVKGKNLFGLYKAKDAIYQKGFVLIVEGYFDVISLCHAGIRNVVATLGTALTRDHLELLRRYTSDVVVLFDSDEAGKKALNRSLELFLSAGMKARALVLPGSCDPDDYVRQFGREKMEELILQAQPLSDYYMDHVLGSGRSFEEKRAMLKEALSFFPKILDKKERDIFVKRLAEKTGVREALLLQEVHFSSGEKQKNMLPGSPGPFVDQDALELHLIQLMMEHPQKIPELEDAHVLDYLLHPEIQDLGKKIVAAYQTHGFIDLDLVFGHDEQSKWRKRLMQRMMTELPPEETTLGKVFADNIRQIKKKWYKNQHRQIKIQLHQAQESGDEDMIRRLLCEKERILLQEKELRS